MKPETRRQYAVVVERAGSNYSAYVPDLPGCIATGQTVAEVTETLREAIEFHIEGLKPDGFLISEPTVRVTSVVVAD